MTSYERAKKIITRTVVVGSLAAAAVSYHEVNNSNKALEQETKLLQQLENGSSAGGPNRLHDMAVAVGGQVLARAIRDKNPAEINPDRWMKNGVDVAIETIDNKGDVSLVDVLMQEVNGQPDAKTSRQVLIDTYSSPNLELQQEFYIEGHSTTPGELIWTAHDVIFSGSVPDRQLLGINTAKNPELIPFVAAQTEKSVAQILRFPSYHDSPRQSPPAKPGVI